MSAVQRLSASSIALAVSLSAVRSARWLRSPVCSSVNKCRLYSLRTRWRSSAERPLIARSMRLTG